MTEINPDDVREDPKLMPEEKEYHYYGSKIDGKVNVFSDIGSMMRDMIKHPEIDVEADREVDGNVVAVRGTMPIGLLKNMGQSRDSDNLSDIISNSY